MDLDAFKRNGFIRIPSHEVWSSEELKQLTHSITNMQEWSEKKGEYMMYFEQQKGKRLLQRVEKFIEYDPFLNQVCQGKIKSYCDQLFQEPAILYKEKVNFKLSGGGGFEPHQDHAAGWWLYGATYHISALISIDASDETNGALEIVAGEHNKGLLGKEWETIPDELVKQWEKEAKWEMVKTQPGDVVLFDSFVPHRSGPNTSEKTRRIMYLTYGKSSEGDHREKFLADKRKNLPPDIERDPTKIYTYKV